MDFATSWRQLGTQGRIDAIRAVWFPGCSTAQIAANFHDVTRNAVIGIYNRYGQTHLTDKPLRTKLGIGQERKSKKRAPIPLANFHKPNIASQPLPEPSFSPTEYHLAGKPLMMLQAKECRFAVNDATGDELHLFCAMPAERSYCAHHRLRAYRSAER